MIKIAFLLPLLTLVTLETMGQDDKDAFIDPEQIASFPGGNDPFIHFINKNLVKPTRSNKKGNVYVSFIVNVDGTLTDFKIEKGLSTKHDESALEVVKKIPKWIPRIMYGTHVLQRYVLQINFE